MLGDARACMSFRVEGQNPSKPWGAHSYLSKAKGHTLRKPDVSTYRAIPCCPTLIRQILFCGSPALAVGRCWKACFLLILVG